MLSFFLKTANAAVDPDLPSIPLLDKINKVIINPFIYLMIGVATLVFFWGVAEMLRNLDNDKARENGKRHMFWGIIGLTIMVCVLGIYQLVKNFVFSFN